MDNLPEKPNAAARTLVYDAARRHRIRKLWKITPAQEAALIAVSSPERINEVHLRRVLAARVVAKICRAAA